MNKIVSYVLADIIRNRMILFYAIILLALSLSVFSLEDTASKGVLSMLNLILMIVPLFSIIFSTIYMYQGSEFIELLISQPIQRKTLWRGMFLGLISSLGIAFLVGAGWVIVLFEPNYVGVLLLACGLLLTFIFSAIAMLAAVLFVDKAKGIGFSVLIWLFYSILFDGLILFLVFQFSDYPIERGMILVSMLNPIDLARIMILMQLDVSALMGYTGAIFKDFFGTQEGILISFSMLILWAIIPFLVSAKKFRTKDL